MKFFNVKDYGAVGCGVADDAQAIQHAIDAATVDGGAVFFPQGDYRIKEPIQHRIDDRELITTKHVVNKKTHRIRFTDETEDSVTVVIEPKN